MKKIKWKNVLIVLGFLLSTGLLVIDSINLMFGYSYTYFGMFTGFIAVVISLMTFDYLEEIVRR